MNPTPHLLTYKDSPIHVEVNGEVMINATEMAAIFGKHLPHYITNASTKDFVKALCQSRNSDFENEFSPTGKFVKVVRGGSNPGTWMHRVVALDLAAWLDPHFRVWILETIEKLLFERYQFKKDYVEQRTDLYLEYRQAVRERDLAKSKAVTTQEYASYNELKQKASALKKRLNQQDLTHLGTQLEISE